jgi:hypothetical protein
MSDELSIVFRVLRVERLEVFKRRAHRAVLRVSPGVHLTIILRERLRIRRRFIPEVREKNSFAPLHQIERHLAVNEVEMPEPRVVVNLLLHVADARNRRFKQGELVDLVRVLRRVSVSDHQTDVVPDQIYSLVTETPDEFVNINRRRLLVIT